MGYGAVEIHENKILPENLQELHVDHIFKVASKGWKDLHKEILTM